MEYAVPLLLLVLAAIAHADIVQFGSCPDYKVDDVAFPRNCSIQRVRIDPCSEAAEGKPCKIRRGRHASISFDYTLGDSADNLESKAYWYVSEASQIPFKGMDTHACNFTTCPATADTETTYTYNLEIDRKYPSREYDVMWRLWNTEEPKKFDCCFIVKIKITK